jgi:SAM-dependent methyltransferase
MDQKTFVERVNGLVAGLRQKAMSGEVLDFLNKCVRAYSSKAHLWNNCRDLELVTRLSPPPQKMLDFGCGIGIQSYLLAEMGYQVVGLETVFDKSLEGFLKQKAQPILDTRDRSMQAAWSVVKGCNRSVSFDVYDGTHLPYSNGTFDIVFSYAVLEHIPRPDVPAIVQGIHHVLKPGGLFYIFQLPQVNSYTEFLARKLNLEAHEFLWSFSEMDRVLEAAGFNVIRQERADMLFNHPHQLVNPLFSVLRPVNRFLLTTPLSEFCHHLTIVGRKAN